MYLKAKLSIFMAIMMVAVSGCSQSYLLGISNRETAEKPEISVRKENYKLENLSHSIIDIETQKLIYDYYSSRQPAGVGRNIRILSVKIYKDGFLISTDITGDYVQTGINLLRLEKNRDGYLYISKVAKGDKPTGIGFSVNRIECDGCTIIFGSFENGIQPLDYKQLSIKLQYRSGNHKNRSQEVKEAVEGCAGYIVIADQICNIKEFTLYDSDNKVGGSLKDLEAFGNEIRNAAFEAYEDTIAMEYKSNIKNVNSVELTF